MQRRDVAPVSRFRSYFELTRLHKFPTGTLLVFWPCGEYVSSRVIISHISQAFSAWGLTNAAFTVSIPPGQLGLHLAAYFVGSTILHSAACVINDICDRDFDRQVGTYSGTSHTKIQIMSNSFAERTKNRPIAAGNISVFGATIFLIAQVVVVVGFLSLTNPLA